MKKEPKDGRTTMTAREVAVLIEDLRSQFRIFGEQLKAVEDRLESKIEGVEGKVDGIATNQAKTLERVTSLEITVRKIQADITEIKETLKGHSERLSHLEVIK